MVVEVTYVLPSFVISPYDDRSNVSSCFDKDRRSAPNLPSLCPLPLLVLANAVLPSLPPLPLLLAMLFSLLLAALFMVAVLLLLLNLDVSMRDDVPPSAEASLRRPLPEACGL